MQVSSLLEAVLPLQGWSVVDVEFREEERELRVRLEPSRRSALCSSCGAARRRHHDHLGERRWRTQDAFGVRTVLRARLRRVDCRQCGVRVEAVPWARPGSRYAKALEREIVEMARNASLLAVSRHFRLGWKAVYGIVKRLVSEALSRRGGAAAHRRRRGQLRAWTVEVPDHRLRPRARNVRGPGEERRKRIATRNGSVAIVPCRRIRIKPAKRGGGVL